MHGSMASFEDPCGSATTHYQGRLFKKCHQQNRLGCRERRKMAGLKQIDNACASISILRGAVYRPCSKIPGRMCAAARCYVVCRLGGPCGPFDQNLTSQWLEQRLCINLSHLRHRNGSPCVSAKHFRAALPNDCPLLLRNAQAVEYTM